VILADENPVLGGIGDLTAGSIDGACVIDHAKAIAQHLLASKNVHVMTRATVVGHWHPLII
jgi:hypothetical protein